MCSIRDNRGRTLSSDTIDVSAYTIDNTPVAVSDAGEIILVHFE